MKILKQRRWCLSGVVNVNCEHVSLFVLIAYVEGANVSWVHIEKINGQQYRIYQALLCIVLSVNKIY